MSVIETASKPLDRAHWESTVSAEVMHALQLPPPSAEDYAGNQIFDVAIIGGGIAGLSAALSAAKSGASVVLFEKGPQLGSGASGRNLQSSCGKVHQL